MSGTEPSICLGMIVKDEEAVIARALRSAASVVDEVVILDTGSTDNTGSVILNTCNELGLPVNVFHSEWEGFGAARTTMMRRARAASECDWLLTMDADMELSVDGKLDGLREDCDAYYVDIKSGELTYSLPLLTKMDHPWMYEGKVYESLTDEGAGGILGATLPITLHHSHGYARGNRSDRYERDLELLEGETDSRSRFYYAQTLWCLSRYEEAEIAFIKRADMGGWDEEVYVSLYRAGLCAKALNDPAGALSLFLKAWDHRPSRLEALYEAQVLLREQGQWRLASVLGKEAVKIIYSMPTDRLFVEKKCWDYACEWEHWVAYGMAHSSRVAVENLERMRDTGVLPEQYLPGTAHNIAWFADQ